MSGASATYVGSTGFKPVRPVGDDSDAGGACIDLYVCALMVIYYRESTTRGKVRSQLIVGGEEVFGLDAGLPDDRHETGISRPAGE